MPRILSKIDYPVGSPSDGDRLTSDAAGVGTWQTPSGGGSHTLLFGSDTRSVEVSANSTNTFDITVTGAVAGDPVALTGPDSIVDEKVSFYAFSKTDAVTVVVVNNSSTNYTAGGAGAIPSATYGVAVIQPP